MFVHDFMNAARFYGVASIIPRIRLGAAFVEPCPGGLFVGMKAGAIGRAASEYRPPVVVLCGSPYF